MKTIVTRAITGSVVVAVLTLTFALASMSASVSASVAPDAVKSQLPDAKERSESKGSQSKGERIVGTWRVQVTLRNCQTGSGLRVFPALLTFADGETLTGTSTVLSPAMRSGDFGIWSHTGGHSYRAVDEAFIFNPLGVWVSTQRLTQEIELAPDADSFTSNAHVEFFDTLGNVTNTGCATAVATRME